jgi:hypothetical protein
VTYFVTLQHFAAISFQLLHRIHDVTPADNRVPLEYAASAPSADLHNHSLGDSSTAQIACCCPAEVMKDQTGVFGSNRRNLPSLSPEVVLYVPTRRRLLLFRDFSESNASTAAIIEIAASEPMTVAKMASVSRPSAITFISLYSLSGSSVSIERIS